MQPTMHTPQKSTYDPAVRKVSRRGFVEPAAASNSSTAAAALRIEQLALRQRRPTRTHRFHASAGGKGLTMRT
jgi:hypothetical protein